MMKKIILLMLAISLLAYSAHAVIVGISGVPSAGGASIGYTDATGVYRFESGALTTDSSGNGYTLTSNGDPVADTTNKVEGGASVLLDGTGDYYSQDNAAFDVTTDVSFALWIRAAVNDEKWIIGIAEDDGNAIYIQTKTYDEGSTYSVSLTAMEGYSGTDNDTGFQPTIGNWYHIVAAFDASDATEWEVWISASGGTFGDQVDGTDYANSDDPTTSGTLEIGERGDTSTAPWPGNLDEVAIFIGRVLTATEAEEIWDGSWRP